MTEKTVLLGLFDGLHRGHMSAVSELLKHKGERVVFTFDSLSMSTKGERGLLMTDEKKRETLLKFGADEVISRDFNLLRETSAEEFVDRILDKELHAGRVICGENFRFGKGAKAGAKELKELCAAKNIEAVAVPTVFDGGEAISTTRIRKLIEGGEISEANRLLGYEYGFEGEIIHGDRIGTSMGIKTLNIGFDTVRALPKKGVYASRVKLSEGSFAGVTNIGTRPTVHEDGKIVIETHLIDFDGDIYGERAEVALAEFLREEKRFGSLEELRAAVAGDISKVKESLKL